MATGGRGGSGGIGSPGPGGPGSGRRREQPPWDLSVLNTSMDPDAKEKQIKSAWKNVKQWERDIALGRERRISTRRARLGRTGLEVDSSLWKEQIGEIEAEAEAQMAEIQAGPNMDMIRSYWGGEAAKDFNTGAWAEATKQAKEQLGVDKVKPGKRTELYEPFKQTRKALFKDMAKDEKRMREHLRERFGD